MSPIRALKHWFPIQLVHDNGSQFMSLEFKHFIQLNGINHLQTPDYHQSSNVQVDRYIQTMKKGLKANTNGGSDLQEKVDSIYSKWIVPS